VGAAFQPVHAVMPPGTTNRLVVESNQGYVQALNQLQAAVSLAANTPQDQAAAAQTRDAAFKAKAVVADLALKFNGDSAAAPAGARMRSLLDEPIDRVDRMLGRLPGVALNEQGSAFCRALNPLLAKYPFQRDALGQATLTEVVAMFEPGNGTLARFYGDALQGVLAKVGNQYDRKAGAPMVATANFVRFFNRLAGVTDALWPRDGTGPRLDFTVKLLPTATLPSASFTMDGQRKSFTRTFTRAERFSWVGANAGDVRLSTEARGREETVLAYNGTWALFRLLQRARWQTLGATSTVVWTETVQGQPVRLEAELNLGPTWSILKGDYFAGLTCMSQVVQ
jgi:type VI protein secretion system component VasK